MWAVGEPLTWVFLHKDPIQHKLLISSENVKKDVLNTIEFHCTTWNDMFFEEAILCNLDSSKLSRFIVFSCLPIKWSIKWCLGLHWLHILIKISSKSFLETQGQMVYKLVLHICPCKGTLHWLDHSLCTSQKDPNQMTNLGLHLKLTRNSEISFF